MRELGDVVILGLLLACAVSDWRKKEIPVYLLMIMGVDVLLLSVCCGGQSIGSRALGAGIGLLFLIVGKCTKEAIGYGDGWLILLLGIYLGAVQLIQLLLAASLMAGVCALFSLWKRRWNKKATLPFVPFLFIGCLGVMFL